MHIPDAVLSPPIIAATSAVGALGLGYALRIVERQLRDRTTSLMGMMSAFIFAAQMVNFPVGPGVSGHLLGGVLASLMLGPWAGAVVIAAVLIVQCFLFGDGGVTALGANFLNMGLIGAVVGHAIYTPVQRLLRGQRGVLIGSMVAAWFTVLLAAGACSLELSASGRRGDFFRILSWMALVHAVIGLAEAVITGLVVRFVLLTRPELIDAESAPERITECGNAVGHDRRLLPAAFAGLGMALAVAVFLSPWASELPDGLEFVGEKTGILGNASESSFIPAPLADYQIPLPGLRDLKAATAIVGVVGTLAVFSLSWGLARVLSSGGRPERVPADAA